MILPLFIAFFAGALVGFVIAALLVAAKRGGEEPAVDPSDPYGIGDRMTRSARSLERFYGSNGTPLGKVRVDLDHVKKRPGDVASSRGRDRREVPSMEANLQNHDAPVESATRNLRACRHYMLGCAGALDAAGEREAVHSLRLALCSLDDCLTELEAPEPPTRVLRPIADPSLRGLGDDLARSVRPRPDTIADDRRDDLMADVDHEDFDRGEV